MPLPWVRLDTAFPYNPKLLAMLAEKDGHRAGLVYVCSLGYSGAHGTDGFIPREALPFVHGRSADARRLVEHGLWAEYPGGWLVDDWEASQEIEVCRKRIPVAVRDLVYERDEYRCVECGATEDLTLDHVHPWSLGGSDTVGNLRVLCRSCNSSKGARI